MQDKDTTNAVGVLKKKMLVVKAKDNETTTSTPTGSKKEMLHLLVLLKLN